MYEIWFNNGIGGIVLEDIKKSHEDFKKAILETVRSYEEDTGVEVQGIELLRDIYGLVGDALVTATLPSNKEYY